MVSTVYFSIDAGGRSWPGLEATVKQTAGSSYRDEPLEVELPAAYDGPMNYAAFRECVEAYYRSAFDRAIHLGPGASVRMRNTRIAVGQTCSFDAA